MPLDSKLLASLEELLNQMLSDRRVFNVVEENLSLMQSDGLISDIPKEELMLTSCIHYWAGGFIAMAQTSAPTTPHEECVREVWSMMRRKNTQVKAAVNAYLTSKP